MTNAEPGFRRATKNDLPSLEVFLAANERPVSGVADQLERFWLAVRGHQIIGSAGVEQYGTVALLRSVAVAPDERNQGIGKALITRIVQDARGAKVTDLYLLTTHADRYFARIGFRILSRSDAPKALWASAEFQGACPETATLMRLPVIAAQSELQNPPSGS